MIQSKLSIDHRSVCFLDFIAVLLNVSEHYQPGLVSFDCTVNAQLGHEDNFG